MSGDEKGEGYLLTFLIQGRNQWKIPQFELKIHRRTMARRRKKYESHELDFTTKIYRKWWIFTLPQMIMDKFMKNRMIKIKMMLNLSIWVNFHTFQSASKTSSVYLWNHSIE